MKLYLAAILAAFISLSPALAGPESDASQLNEATEKFWQSLSNTVPERFRGRMRYGAEIEFKASEVLGFFQALDFNSYFRENPKALKIIPDDMLNQSLLSDAEVRNSLPKDLETKFVRSGKRWNDFVLGLDRKTKESLLVPNRMGPLRLAQLSLHMNQVPDPVPLKDIPLRADLPAGNLLDFKPFEWDEDGAGVIEFRHRTPATEIEHYVEDLNYFADAFEIRERLYKVGDAEALSYHNHISVQGESLRSHAAMLNLSRALERADVNIDPYKGNAVGLRKVDKRGFLRLFEPDRIEFRSSRFVAQRQDTQLIIKEGNFLNTLSEFFRAIDQPKAFAAEISKMLIKLPALIEFSKKPGKHEPPLTPISEGLAAIEHHCPGCMANNRIVSVALAELTKKFPEEAHFIRAHIPGLAPQAYEQATRVVGPKIEGAKSVDDLLEFARIRVPALESLLKDRVQTLSAAERAAFVGRLTDNDSPAMERFAVETLRDLVSKKSSELPIALSMARGFPKHTEIRSTILGLLGSPDPDVAMNAAKALSRVTGFFKPEEHSLLRSLILKHWNGSSPVAAEMRKAYLSAGDGRILDALLDHYLDDANSNLKELLPAFVGHHGVVLEGTLAKRLKSSQSATRARILDLTSHLRRIEEPLQLALAEVMRDLTPDERLNAVIASRHVALPPAPELRHAIRVQNCLHRELVELVQE